MNNLAFRQKLQELINNTTLNRETAFTYNGTTFSPFEYGPIGGNDVNIFVPGDATVHGHSHYNPATYGTFSPQDIYALYEIYTQISDPMGFTMVIATSGGGVSMMKIVDKNKFSTFGNTYLNNSNWETFLAGVYDWWGVGLDATASSTLQALLDLLNAGLKVTHIPNPGQGSGSNPCQ